MLSIRPYEPRDADPTLEVLRAAITVTARADYSERQTRRWASRAARPVLLRMGFEPDPAADDAEPDPAAHDDAADGLRTVLIDGVAFTNVRLARWLRPGAGREIP